jgi:RND family efflux transporter MFP subunit
MGIPLCGADQKPTAALLLLGHSDEELRRSEGPLVELSPTLAGLAQLCDQATPSRWTSATRRIRQSLAGRRKLMAFAVLVAVTLISLVPVSDRVVCQATLEPSLRRYVGAPFDGKLDKAVARVGDAVAAGQPIAVLDKRPLEIELSMQQSQLDEAAKRRDAARAKGQAAQAQLAELECAQFSRKIEQLEHQLQELTVTSPIDGVIVRGQLERVEGAPLTRGQNLFEIAPLSPLVAELAIPEDEVRLVKSDLPVTVRPLALPGRSLAARISRIHPRAEVRDGQVVFIAEVTLPNDDRQLRPGMQARATVQAGRQPLVWTLVRRPLVRFSRWLWW